MFRGCSGKAGIALRLKIRFGIKAGSEIDFNYQWYLAAMIYGVIEEIAPDFAKVLHDSGLGHLDSKRFKFFTFSNLWAGRGKTEVNGTKLRFCIDNLLWQFDTPISPLSTLLADALLSKRAVRIGTMDAKVLEISSMDPPDFSNNTCLFSCISPLVASVSDPALGHKYLSPDDEQFWEVIRNNLRWKWEALYGKNVPDGELAFYPDTEYMRRRSTSKFINFKRKYVVKGHILPFETQGPMGLLKLGYHAGFGSKNSLGFGMVELARSK